MRLTLTNDDGIDAPGLHALCAALVAEDHDVTVVAPDQDRSGASASIGRLEPGRGVPVVPASDFPVAGARAYRIEGPPGLAAMTACLGAFGEPPEVLVSGVNSGPNTGHAILHSGTVGAALTAQTFGVSGIAVSVEDVRPWNRDGAIAWARHALAIIADEPTGTVLNVNAPARDPDEIVGMRWATLDRFGSVRLAVAGTERGEIQLELRDTGSELEPESDTALLRLGYATFTRLVGVSVGVADRDRNPEELTLRAVEGAS